MPEELQTIDDIVSKLLEIKAKYGNIKVAEVTYSSNVNKPTVDIDMIEPQVILTSVTDDELIVVFK
jgi:hypothetical protein